jgi:ribonucleoside-diphosphate reductase beta chain
LLSTEEQLAFDKIISFLVFMDSLLVSAIPSINEYITLPEIKLLLSIHAFQEALHSQSYGYILETVVPAEKRRHIYDLAINDEHMKSRNQYIASFYQVFVDNPTDVNFLRVIMAEYLLEGIYFYSGFAFFYNLARLGKMTGVGTEIKYINRDESAHMTLFQNIFKELRKEKPELFDEDTIEELRGMCKTAVDHEVAWATYAYGECAPGLNPEIIQTYIRYLSNNRLRNLKLEPIWPEVKNNPIPFITRMATFNGTKTDFFEEKPINYSKAGADLKLDDLDDFEL